MPALYGSTDASSLMLDAATAVETAAPVPTPRASLHDATDYEGVRSVVPVFPV